MERRLVPTLDAIGYSRYVDDIFLITQNETTANHILDLFNDAHPQIKFELEKPCGTSLKLLDIEVEIKDGKLSTNFYVKGAEADLFLPNSSAVPTRMKQNVIRQEWRRMVSKIKVPHLVPGCRKYFLDKLKLNGYDVKMVEKILNEPQKLQHVQDTEIFYLTIPFFGDSVNKRLKKALAPTGLNVRISHRGRTLGLTVMNIWRQTNVIKKCQLAKCPLNNNMCLVSRIVYKCTCQNCGASYIGSTYRAMHVRIKEHTNLRNSPIFKHNLTCQPKNWKFQMVNKCENVIDLRIRESILIAQDKPNLNTKDDFNLFDITIYD
jgi:hypothetical protein